MPAQRSIVICGGAFAGLALALALRQGLGPDIPVIVADPALGLRPSRDPRATAIVAACRRLFEALGVWDQVAPTAQPITDMVVTDSKLDDATRPVFLTFVGDVEPGEPFAHMVENRHLIDALAAQTEAAGVELRATAVASFDSRADGIDVTLADGTVIEASLLVAADGARSRLRERAGIATHGWDYDTWHEGRLLDQWADPRAVAGLREAYAQYGEADVRRALFATMDLFRWLERRPPGGWASAIPRTAIAAPRHA